MPLVVRFTLILLCASLLPLAGFGWIALDLIEDTIDVQFRSARRNLADVALDALRLHMDAARGKLKTMAALLDEHGGGRDGSFDTARLNSLLEPPDIFLDLSVYRIGRSLEQLGQAKQTARSPAQEAYQTFQADLNRPFLSNGSNFLAIPWNSTLTNDHPMVRLAKSGNEVFSPALQESEGTSFLPMAVSIGSRSDLILVAGLDLAPVWKHFTAIGGDREVQLADGVGNRLISSRPVPIEGELLEERIPVGHADWSIVVREPRELRFFPLQQAREHAIRSIAVAGLFAVVLIFGLTTYILKPVRALTAAADRLRSGDLEARVNLRQGDELGRLGDSFDRMAAALQQLDRAKSDFVAHVSHELRTPLTSIKLSVANLLDGVVGPVDAPKGEVLGRVRADLDRLIGMVNELLDVAKLEAGKLELHPEPLDLAAVARDAAATLKPIAERKGVTLTLETSESPMTGDRARLHEIIVNLADNAIKFTPAGGRVGIAVSPRLLVVRDSGCGIPADRQPKLFEKFARVNADTGIPGAGLGLSITKKLVELHGGRIAVESAEGRGSTFTVRF